VILCRGRVLVHSLDSTADRKLRSHPGPAGMMMGFVTPTTIVKLRFWNVN
jgi:hypothetical protein